MSPEQLSGQVTDTRSDLFSTSVIIFEAITGRLPFKGANYADLLRAMAEDSPTIPGSSADIVRLNTLLRKCLAADRSERFQTANELRTELLPALRAWAHA
jgi:serine/threonine protein kinase